MADAPSVRTDHWFYSLFQSMPDLIALLLQAAGAAAAAPSLGPESPGNQLYRFEAVELKALNHRLDGVLWPLRPGSPWCSSTPRRAICGWWWWCPIARIQALLDFSGAEDLAVWLEAHAG